ncbi:hypothetical protein, partial [Pseudoalteromonas sp. S1608]|uniref:hypothetical protein n=1 Tax=Pseudoalteromonas sp. S1608 TaxID=579504 RepID=UPI001BB0E4D2
GSNPPSRTNLHIYTIKKERALPSLHIYTIKKNVGRLSGEATPPDIGETPQHQTPPNIKQNCTDIG